MKLDEIWGFRKREQASSQGSVASQAVQRLEQLFKQKVDSKQALARVAEEFGVSIEQVQQWFNHDIDFFMNNHVD